MLSLAMAVAAFVLIHLLVSGTRVRDGLVARMGEGPYMGLFSLASVGLLIWMVAAYGAARQENIVWWGPEPLRHLSWLVQLIGVLLIVTGLLTPNPTSVKQEGALDKGDPVRGVLRITRHPFLWGWRSGRAGTCWSTATSPACCCSAPAAAGRARRRQHRRQADPRPRREISRVQVGDLQRPLRRHPPRPPAPALGEIGWRLPVALLVYAGLFAAHPLFAGVSAAG
jgi:hypothetical protein